MEIEKVSVNYGRTVATPIKFEFLRIDVGMEASITKEDNKKKAIIVLEKNCKEICEGLIGKELEEMGA